MSVKVAVRARPLSADELKDDTQVVIRMNGNEVAVASTSGDTARVFRYDIALWSVGLAVEGSTNVQASQEAVYDALGAEMLEHTLTGYNGCIFTYGQTGSGKTYSMMGSGEHPGIVPRLAENLFKEAERLREADIETCIQVSYFEIYCEKVRCLLRPTAGGFADSALRVREHPKFGPFIEGLAKFVVDSQTEFLQLLSDGNKVRTTASTGMNAVSSRSHAVFAINLTQRRNDGRLATTTTSRLNLVDLAGSERASKSLATGKRLVEGANINQSLTCLGNVISALADIEETGKARHIPYRDSVLTWILKDNLGGNSKTVMLATVSPSSAQLEETMSTLRYAERAKKIMNNAIVNESNSNEVIAALQKEIASLKLQLNDASTAERARLLEELAASEAVQRELGASLEEKLAETKRMMEERETYMRELENKLEAQSSEIEDLRRTNDEKERKIADLLRRIEALASAATVVPAGGPCADIGSAGAPHTVDIPTGTRQTAMEKMREEVAALEQEQNAAETQMKGRNRLASVVAGDTGKNTMLEAGGIADARILPAGAVSELAAASASAIPVVAASVYVDEAVQAEDMPVALRQGLLHLQVARSRAGSTVGAPGRSRRPSVMIEGLAAMEAVFDADLDSLDSNREALFDTAEATESSIERKGEAPAANAVLEIDSDIDLDPDLDDAVLEVDDDIVLDEDEGLMEDKACECALEGALTSTCDTPATRTPASSPALATLACSRQPLASAPVRDGEDGEAVLTPPTKVESSPAWSSEHAGGLTEVPPSTRDARVASLHSESAAMRTAQEREQQQYQHALESALALEMWAKSEARPEIYAPSQNVVELVVPSHTLPNNRYLHEPFKVVKMKESAVIGARKDRIWDIDFFGHTFGNYDLGGTKSFSLPSSHLFRVEKDACNAKRLTLHFLRAPHPYELEFISASRRRRFYELAMLQRRNSILWCPSLCLDGENDIAITVQGTTIERPGRILNVEGEAKFTVARMPYEVIDLWYGCLSLQNGPLPRSTAVFGSFIPQATHDVYIIGVADVPSNLLGTGDLGRYFLNHLGADGYHVVGTTTMNAAKRRSPNNAMVIICRDSFIARVSRIQLMEALTVHHQDVSRGDFTGVACSFTMNEATVCAILVNAKPTKYSTQTRNACIRSLITSFPLGDSSVDIAARFDYLIISGTFGYPPTSALFTPADPIAQQIRLNSYLSNVQESEPSAALRMLRDPMRVFFAVRPRVSRMDVGLYTSSRALPLPNAYITADIFAQRSYLSVFGEMVPRTQIIFDDLRVVGDRLPDVPKAQLVINGDFFDGAPLTAPALKEGAMEYTAAATAVPIVYPSVDNSEFLRLQTVYFSLVGVVGPSRRTKPSSLASGALPLKKVIALGERKEFTVPLFYHSCLVGALHGSILQIFREKHCRGLAAAGLSRERFVSLVVCYENQVRHNGAWVPASVQPPFCDFSGNEMMDEQSRESFTLPDPRNWSWLSDWRHDSRPDDSEGWVYSDGGSASFELKESKQSTIRRRRWTREMQAQDGQTLHAYLSRKFEQTKESSAE